MAQKIPRHGIDGRDFMLDIPVPEHSRENCDRLAEQVVDGMDTKDLMWCMIDHLAECYRQDKDNFLRTWDDIGMEDK
jgi:hypothetical protein